MTGRRPRRAVSRPVDTSTGREVRAETSEGGTRDDTDTGWGERAEDDARARWLREQRPPHWG